MAATEYSDPTEDPTYREFVREYPDVSPETIEIALQFLYCAAKLNLRKEEVYERHGLTSGRFSLLMILRGEPSRSLSPSELAKRTHVSRATMTQFVDGLERDQLVRRVDDPEDRRAMRIELTAKGSATLKRVLPEHFGLLTGSMQTLTRAERKQLLHLMNKLTPGQNDDI